MKILLSSIFLFLFSFSSSNEDKITWSESYKLSWSDFQGIPESGSGYVASTNSGMALSFSYSERVDTLKFDFEITSYFYPKLSWVKPNSKTEYILKHEQTHFDISELHTRIFRKRMSEAIFSSNIKQEVQELYELTEAERKQMQQRFDSESDNSQNKESEYEWRNFVSKQLELYNGWK